MLCALKLNWDVSAFVGRMFYRLLALHMRLLTLFLNRGLYQQQQLNPTRLDQPYLVKDWSVASWCGFE
jgi:hypothetical protein